MEQLFKLKENGTTVRTEILAGLTTFMTMAYIIALNPNLLTGFAVGTPLWNGVFLATCLASALGTACMAFLANKPFVMAPGMGLNSFFAVIAGNIAAMANIEYTNAFQAALCIILVEGIVFIALSVLNIREKIVHAIPIGVRLGIGPAIGLMLMNIGFGSNAGVHFSTFFAMRDFFGAMTPKVFKTTIEEAGGNYSEMVLTVITMFVGLFIIILLAKKGIKAAVLLGMLAASVVFWIGEAVALHTNPFASLATASFLPPFADMMNTTFFKFDFHDFFSIGWFTAITLIITFCMIDMFDTIGTLVGTASRAGMTDKEGNMPNMKEALLSDAVGTVAGACMGTSTVTTFVESASGVEAGGRTGLTAVCVAVLFALSLFLSPFFMAIPAFATAPALIVVGFLMVSSLTKIDFTDITESFPAYIATVTMVFMYSISEGIAMGFISYVVINVLSGDFRKKSISPVMYILAVIFILKYIYV